MTTITDEYMHQVIARTKEYCVVLPKAGPNRYRAGVEKTIWEHGRNNFAHREEGLLPVVFPVSDGSDVCGVGIFNAIPDRVREIMEKDPGVRGGVFVDEVHPCRSFPGNCLP